MIMILIAYAKPIKCNELSNHYKLDKSTSNFRVVA